MLAGLQDNGSIFPVHGAEYAIEESGRALDPFSESLTQQTLVLKQSPARPPDTIAKHKPTVIRRLLRRGNEISQVRIVISVLLVPLEEFESQHHIVSERRYQGPDGDSIPELRRIHPPSGLPVQDRKNSF